MPWDENIFLLKEADAEQAKQTGGMVAAYPAPEFAQRLVVPGGEPIEDLHVTLCYYGEDVTQTLGVEQLFQYCQSLATGGPIAAEAWAWAIFNPNNIEFDPCAVYLIGRTPVLSELHEQLVGFGESLWGDDFHTQHEPYVPHLTAGYGLPITALSYTGPVIFDRLALEWGGNTYNFPL